MHYRITEGNKERIQQYQGVVIQRKGSGASATFTVREISTHWGVERIFNLVMVENCLFSAVARGVTGFVVFKWMLNAALELERQKGWRFV